MKPAADQHAGRNAGWSLLETMIAVGVIATGLMVLVQQLSISFRESHSNERLAFAYQKAGALLGEIQNSIALGKLQTSDELYALVDRTPNIVLTTRTDSEGLPFAPEHPMSGNVQRKERWAWSRRVAITPHENTGRYYCNVEVLWLDDGDQWRSQASVALLFALLPSTDAPEQVHDVYLLACAETPSLWTDLAELRSHYEAAASTIFGHSQAQMRYHWITRLGYGRDASYAPFVNTTRTADLTAPMSYWLPGKLGGAQLGKTLYHSEMLAGIHLTELGMVHAPTATEPVPSAIADQWNHCLRTPAAWRLFEQRVAAGLERADEPPLQLLLDDLQQRPEVYRNAVFVNLHGRGLPAPPLRNYADAAKDPIGRPGVRVVTHPARLWTPLDPDRDGDHADTQPLDLRVHGYRTQAAADTLAEPVLVQIFGADLTSSVNDDKAPTLLIDRLVGGVDPASGKASTAIAYEPFAPAPTTADADCAMWFECGYTAGTTPHTWLRLYNTPLTAPVVGTRGLAANAQLYGFEHVPSPVTGDFAHDLATDSAGLLMRNTARWRIRIPTEVFSAGILPNADRVVRVVTRIGTDTTTGQRWPNANQPHNASETWAWWTRAASAVPATERAQFLGDPRLCPYADLLATGTGSPHGYNWNFDDLEQPLANAQPLWPGLHGARLRDGFASGSRADAPRLLQLLRDGIQRTNGVLVNAVDQPAHTLLLGGEIAWPTSTGTTGLALAPDFTGRSLSSVDTIDQTTGCGALVLQRGNPATWWHKPWLGELFPDDLAALWYKSGNLPLPGTTLQWRRLQGNALPGLPYGTAAAGPIGSVMGATGTSVFAAWMDEGKATLTVDGPLVQLQTAEPAIEAINAASKLVPPNSLANARTLVPYGANSAPMSVFAYTDTYPHSSGTLLESAWGHTGGTTGLLMQWSGALGTGVLAPWTAEPSALTATDVATQSLLLGLRGLHAAGNPALPDRITQLPLLDVLEPTSGTAVPAGDDLLVRWRTQWLRFDGKPYTDAYPPGYAQSEGDLVYRVLWSSDGGATWTSALTEQPTTAGTWPALAVDRLVDTGTGNESLAILLPASVPVGDCLLRVEGWRSNLRSHGAVHQVRILVRGAP